MAPRRAPPWTRLPPPAPFPASWPATSSRLQPPLPPPRLAAECPFLIIFPCISASCPPLTTDLFALLCPVCLAPHLPSPAHRSPSLLTSVQDFLSIPLPFHAHLSCSSLDLGPIYLICTHLSVSCPSPVHLSPPHPPPPSLSTHLGPSLLPMHLLHLRPPRPSPPPLSICRHLCPSPPPHPSPLSLSTPVHLPHRVHLPHPVSLPSGLPIWTPTFPHLVPQGYAQLGSRLAPALPFRPGAPHACGRISEGTEERVSDPYTPAPSSPAPSPPRPSPGSLMWLSFRLLLYRASCVSPSYGENSSSPLLRTPTSGAGTLPGPGTQEPDPKPSPLRSRRGTPAPPLGDPEPISPHAPGLPQLGVEGATAGDSQRSKVKGNFWGEKVNWGGPGCCKERHLAVTGGHRR